MGRTVAPAQQSQITPAIGLGAPLSKRNAGVSVLGAAIAVAGLGGGTVGVGLIFAALIVGTARNPSMKEDLVTYTFMGLAFVEFFAIIMVLAFGLLLYSE